MGRGPKRADGLGRKRSHKDHVSDKEDARSPMTVPSEPNVRDALL